MTPNGTPLATGLATVITDGGGAWMRRANKNPAGAGFSVGEPGGIRTHNQLIKSQMLCR